MGKNKIGLNFKGFEEYLERIERCGGDIKELTEKALEETHNYITPKLKADMEPHRLTGETEKAIDNVPKVTWSGTMAELDVGFHIRDGGLPSIFLMYGTPRMPKDQKLYNDIYGTKTKKEVGKIQKDIFADEIRRRMEG